MRRFQILPGHILAEITCADVSALLNSLTMNGLILLKIRYCDDLTVRLTVRQQDYPQLVALSERYGAVVRKIRISGVFPIISRLCKRPVLLMFLLLIFALTCYIPGRIFFISVEGNIAVPDRYILQVAAECGIDFGAKRRLVRSEMMKNRLLEKIPQLQWSGINTSGCTAVISVREKTSAEPQAEPKYQVSSIVASRDGVIQNCTVFQGNSLCTVGQAVKAGQILVSGYLDCGTVIKTTRAEAEIKALTIHDLEVVTPVAAQTNSQIRECKTKYSLKIGKKLIKFFKDSGNLDTTCGKIYSKEYVYLPGGFRLPIAIIKETKISYISDRGEQPISNTGDWLKDFADGYLKENMISGEIISTDVDVTSKDDVVCLRGKYACMEMIGQIMHEEFIPKDDEK